MNLTQLKFDNALFYDPIKKIYIPIYVNDIKAFLFNSNINSPVLHKFFAKYKTKFYLGIEINRLHDDSILFTQRKYIKFLLIKVWYRARCSSYYICSFKPIYKSPKKL